MQFFAKPKIEFVTKGKFTLYAAVIYALLLPILALIFSGLHLGIDFLGGTSLGLRFQEEIAIADIRSAISRVGFDNAEIKHFGAPNDILIRVQEQELHREITDTIKEGLRNAFPDNPFLVQSVESVGPKIGSELKQSAFWAIVVSLVAILAYISLRFKSFAFAVGAIVALIHDILVTLGIFSVFQWEISLAIIAAFLTIIGYSLNDTIVVFDRIRENVKKKTRPNAEIVNASLNQTLSRTIVTSLTTLIVVLIVFFFGGEILHNFALALTIGIFTGTYSSLFIASPVLLLLNKQSFSLPDEDESKIKTQKAEMLQPEPERIEPAASTVLEATEISDRPNVVPSNEKRIQPVRHKSRKKRKKKKSRRR